MRPVPISLLVLALAVALAAPLAADTKFVDTFKAPEAANITFSGQKVAALVVSNDMGLRESAETQLATELTGRGMRGVAAFRIVPVPETRNVARVREFLEKSEVQAVVVIRPVSLTSERAPTMPVMWNSGYYGGLYDYWGYGWGAVYEFGPPRRPGHRNPHLQRADQQAAVGRGHPHEEPEGGAGLREGPREGHGQGNEEAGPARRPLTAVGYNRGSGSGRGSAW
jgi:hypothetical protein